MEIKIDKNRVLKISHKLKRGEFYSFSEGKKFRNISIYKKPTNVNGITSSCEDGMDVLFGDYDNICKHIVLMDISRIQKKYKLPPFYIFSTKEEEDENGELFGNYHIICLIKLNPKQIHDILSKIHIDSNYASMPLRNKYKNFVLRISNKGKRNKPKFLGIIGEMENLDREISKPHLDFLKRIYKLPSIPYSNPDKNKKIYLQQYETLNI